MPFEPVVSLTLLTVESGTRTVVLVLLLPCYIPGRVIMQILHSGILNFFRLCRLSSTASRSFEFYRAANKLDIARSISRRPVERVDGTSFFISRLALATSRD